VRRWRWTFRRFCPSKTEIFVHLGRETPQERLRNGWRNGRVSAKVTASASPRGDQRSWEVALPSDQASRRSIPARARVPPGPFSPTLYRDGEFQAVCATGKKFADSYCYRTGTKFSSHPGFMPGLPGRNVFVGSRTQCDLLWPHPYRCS
jgi:hypothetical protein